jgi:hypothetical protein
MRECRAEDAADWEDAFEARLAQGGLKFNDEDENERYRDMTALHWACNSYDAASRRYLLGRGADGDVDIDAQADAS